MTFIRLLLGRILRLFQSLAGLFKRAMCFMRKRDNIGELPYTVVVQRPGEGEQPQHVATAPVDWGNDQWSEKAMVEDKIDQWRKSKVAPVEQSKEPDFFSDMAPEIQKAKKAILRPRAPSHPASQPRNLFGFQGDDSTVPSAGAELGELNDTDAWEEDDISSTLHEHRVSKQKARHEEYDRRMMTRKGVPTQY